MSTFIKGEALILSIWNADVVPAAYEPIGCLTNNALSITRGIIETQTKCDPGQVIRQAGTSSSEISFEAIYIKTEEGKTDYDACLSFINSATGTSIYWKLSTDQTTPTDYYGTGILADLSLDASAGDEFATFSGTIQNTGLITETTQVPE